jgi:hypothetical protein
MSGSCAVGPECCTPRKPRVLLPRISDGTTLITREVSTLRPHPARPDCDFVSQCPHVPVLRTCFRSPLLASSSRELTLRKGTIEKARRLMRFPGHESKRIKKLPILSFSRKIVKLTAMLSGVTLDRIAICQKSSLSRQLPFGEPSLAPARRGRRHEPCVAQHGRARAFFDGGMLQKLGLCCESGAQRRQPLVRARGRGALLRAAPNFGAACVLLLGPFDARTSLRALAWRTKVDGHGNLTAVEQRQGQGKGQAQENREAEAGVVFPDASDIHIDRGPSLTRKRSGSTRHLRSSRNAPE